MSKCPMWTKKATSEKRKFGSHKELGLKWNMNEPGTFRKKSDPKNRKKSKNLSKIAACEQKNQ